MEWYILKNIRLNMMNSAKPGQKVIVRTANGHEVGTVVESKKLKNRKYYTIQMERGTLYELVPFNKPESAVYIDGKLSKVYQKNK